MRGHIPMIVFVVAGGMATVDAVELNAATACATSRGIQKNAALEAVVPFNGHFVFELGGAGFVDRDGALGIKFPWQRLIKGKLIVGGRRLDAEAPPARAYMNTGYGEQGFLPSYLVFPTPGCWQVTGRVDGHPALTFVVLVEKLGAGPSWQFTPPEDGSWYQTTLEHGIEPVGSGDHR